MNVWDFLVVAMGIFLISGGCAFVLFGVGELIRAKKEKGEA